MPVNQFLRWRDERRSLQSDFQERLMSSSNRRDDAPATERDPPAPASPTGGADAYATWLDRMQRARARQAAITRNLYTWSNYKSWADQVRDSWAATDASIAANTPGKTRK
jgi:hypothetical protein